MSRKSMYFSVLITTSAAFMSVSLFGCLFLALFSLVDFTHTFVKFPNFVPITCFIGIAVSALFGSIAGWFGGSRYASVGQRATSKTMGVFAVLNSSAAGMASLLAFERPIIACTAFVLAGASSILIVWLVSRKAIYEENEPGT